MWGYSARSTKNYQVIAQELLNNNDLYGYSARSTKEGLIKLVAQKVLLFNLFKS